MAAGAGAAPAHASELPPATCCLGVGNVAARRPVLIVIGRGGWSGGGEGGGAARPAADLLEASLVCPDALGGMRRGVGLVAQGGGPGVSARGMAMGLARRHKVVWHERSGCCTPRLLEPVFTRLTFLMSYVRACQQLAFEAIFATIVISAVPVNTV